MSKKNKQANKTNVESTDSTNTINQNTNSMSTENTNSASTENTANTNSLSLTEQIAQINKRFVSETLTLEQKNELIKQINDLQSEIYNQISHQRNEERKKTIASLTESILNEAFKNANVARGMPDQIPSYACRDVAAFIAELRESVYAAFPYVEEQPKTTGTRLRGDEKEARDNNIAADFQNGMTAKQIAAKYGISEGMVNVIKKQKGLVNSR